MGRSGFLLDRGQACKWNGVERRKGSVLPRQARRSLVCRFGLAVSPCLALECGSALLCHFGFYLFCLRRRTAPWPGGKGKKKLPSKSGRQNHCRTPEQSTAETKAADKGRRTIPPPCRFPPL